MKLGTSYSRCLRDIVNGVVQFDDVMIIIARTDFDPENDTQWQSIWHGYANDAYLWGNSAWYEYNEREQEFRDMSIKLKKAGKLHQPRQFGAFPSRLNEYWYDLVLTSDTLAQNPAAKKAFENYKLIAGLVK
jgi:hypothetical protein